MTNQTIQQPKIDQKRSAIASLVLGIISIILYLIPGLFLFFGMNPMSPPSILNIVFLSPLLDLLGLILGILGLKSTKRNFAIAGIILCLVGLLVPLYYFLFY